MTVRVCGHGQRRGATAAGLPGPKSGQLAPAGRPADLITLSNQLITKFSLIVWTTSETPPIWLEIVDGLPAEVRPEKPRSRRNTAPADDDTQTVTFAIRTGAGGVEFGPVRER